MGLLQKREMTQAQSLYAISGNQTLLIVGLGNPGNEYTGTRHNIGFKVVDTFAAQNDFSGWVEKKTLKCLQADATLGGSKVILIKPTTFMNLSGEAVAAVQQFYRVYNQHTIVVHDELDIPFGEIRTKVGGGTAGHNGLKSLVAHTGEDFGRIRVGIHNDIAERAETTDFVLGSFSKSEQDQLGIVINEAVAVLSEYIFSGGQLHIATRKAII